jgi:hypothetical protein
MPGSSPPSLYSDRLAEQVDLLAHHAFRGKTWKEAVACLHRAHGFVPWSEAMRLTGVMAQTELGPLRSACISQNAMPISRYIVAAAVRCCWAFPPLPVRR